jgi:2-polyprenyl-3-methyl-5-hydroxy-6-metoxy-1,4-benzoquinol methylase
MSNSAAVEPATGKTISSFTQEEQVALWFKTIDPKGVGPAEAIAEEIAGYTGEPLELVLEKMASGMQDLKDLWLRSRIEADDASSVASFYRDQFVEAYELANWHCGRTFSTPPLNYARAAMFAERNGLRHVLDFGSGIGSGSLCFHEVGCQVDSADIAERLLDFVEYRFKRRGYSARLINLNKRRPPGRTYDLIACFDVLEHIPDQQAKLRELASYLRVGGYLITNLMPDSSHPDQPMHVSSALDWLLMVRRTKLVPDWDNFYKSTHVLKRTRFGWLRNRIGRWVDWTQQRFGK